MEKHITLGIVVSIIALMMLMALAALLQSNTGELTPSTYALLGWVSGAFGMFFAASIRD